MRDWRPSLEPRYREAMTEKNGGNAVERPRCRARVRGRNARRLDDALKRLRQAQPGARVEVVDSGHDVPEDAPEETVRLVAEFLG